jgi:hypothetical protein
MTRVVPSMWRTSRPVSSGDPTASMHFGFSSTQTKTDGQNTRRSGTLRGAPGGLSFTLTGTFENLPGRGEPTSVSVMVAADAARFSDQGGACGAAGPASAPGRTGYGPRIEWLGCHTNRHSAQPVGGSHADPGHQEAKVSASRSTICDAFAVSLAGVIGG